MPALQNFNEEELKFIRENLRVDPLKLSLKFHGSRDKKDLIAQISARQKLRKKLPEWVSQEQIRFTSGLPLEQASSELTARLKANQISGKKIIDLTGGLGVDCFYLSHSFNQAIYIEQQESLAEYARYNYAVLGSDIEVRQAQAETAIIDTDADVLYLDPHRRGGGNIKQFMLSDHQPNVLSFLPELIKGNRKTLIKTSPMLDISMAIEQLQHVAEVWVISLGNDCKEVVYLLNAQGGTNPKLRTWNHSRGHWQYYENTRLEHQRPELSEPGQYLYEPNASIFKAGLQDQVAVDFQLHKLSSNSHLYTGSQLQIQYPGRIFEVQEVLRAWDKAIKGGRYNVISRNFHESAAYIEKKMKLKPAHDDFLIATQLSDKRSVFLIAKLIGTAE